MRVLLDQITSIAQGLFVIQALNLLNRFEQALLVEATGRITGEQAGVQTQHQQEYQNPFHKTDSTRSAVIFHCESTSG